MQGYKPLIEYWNDIESQAPPGLSEHTRMSMKATFFTGALAYEHVQAEIIEIAQGDPESGVRSLKEAAHEVRQTLELLRVLKQQLDDEEGKSVH